jgi:peptidoglycan/LPS O-acetylase OafA/YrhL
MMLQSREMVFYYNPPFWSLPAEVEFYLLLPVMAWGLSKWRWRWGWLWLLAIALGLKLTLGQGADKSTQNVFYMLNLHLPGILIEFLLGALAWRLAQLRLQWLWRGLLVLSGLAGWCVLAAWFGQVGDVGVAQTVLKEKIGALAALCFALMVAGSLGTGSWPATPASPTSSRARSAAAGSATSTFFASSNPMPMTSSSARNSWRSNTPTK